MADQPTPWICEDCGEVAQGVMCMKCGNTREVPSPEVRPAALQWGFLHKAHDSMAAKILLLILLIPLLILLVGLFIPRR